MKKRLFALIIAMGLLLNSIPTVFAVDDATNAYSENVISILGDSISTFSGYCPDGYRMRYPDSNSACDVLSVDKTWWMQLITELNATLGISESWAGSTVSNILDAKSGDRGPDAAMASWTRINNLAVNGTPDVILFYGGTNDRTYVANGTYTLGTFDADTAPSQASGTDVTKWDTVVDAYSDAILRMKSAYPNATIISILPIDKGDATYEAFNAQIKAVCDHYRIPTVSLDSVSSSDLYDGLHPDAYGMDIITAEVKAVLTNTPVVLPDEPIIDVGTYLQQLPDDAYNTTNLWTSLRKDNVYYNGSAWAGGINSITIPVEAGNQIYANSFKKGGENGGTQNGIRVTYFAADNTVLDSLPPATVYSEYNSKGYLTVPKDAVAVNIPMWVNDASSTVYLLTLPSDPNVEVQEPTHSKLQQLPIPAYSDTNLWTALTPLEGRYGNNGAWTTDFKSILIPVEPGDRVYASSFQKAGDNGYSTNGIRVVYFYGDTYVSSPSAAEVYNEFNQNGGGWLTIPTGVNAICIPMWTNDPNPTVYLLDLPTRVYSVDVMLNDPVTGVAPITEVSGTSYTGTVEWSPAVDSTFAGGVEYTATVTLTAADGYEFAEGLIVTINGHTAAVNNDGSFSHTFAATEVIKAPENSYLQWVEDDTVLYSDTNLWDLLEHNDKYYNGSTWGTLTQNGEKVTSVTIPIEPGDKIYATSFASGIRVTYFYGDEVVKSFAPADIKTQYANNGGYIVVPSDLGDINAVCIPMWTETGAVLNLLSLPTKVYTADLTITVPVTGSTPDTTLSGTGYSGVIAWSPAVNGTFASGEIYTANIVLEAAENYLFADDTVVTVNEEVVDFNINTNGTVTVSYTFDATVVEKTDFLVWFDDETGLYSDTNLWDLLEHNDKYYNGSTWGKTGNVMSITIPVEPGDQIFATSFQKSGTNGGTRNGIRVTYFYGNTVVESIAPDDVYAEYNAKGYLTVPAGVNAVCIALWQEEGGVVNLLTLPDRPGEISGDGEVDETDAMILARYLAGWSGYEDKIVSMEAADLNGDGKVSDIDAMILARYLAGWPNYDEYFK